MDAKEIAAVLDIYEKRYSKRVRIVIQDPEVLKKEAQHFLFSDTSLLDIKELSETLDHLEYLHQEPRSIPRISAQEFPHDRSGPTPTENKEHCLAMFPKMSGFIAQGKLEKCLRWVGFVWGCSMYLHGSFAPIDLLKSRMKKILEFQRYYFSEGRLDLACAFLGMIQGILWSAGAYSLDELKAHNRNLTQ